MALLLMVVKSCLEEVTSGDGDLGAIFELPVPLSELAASFLDTLLTCLAHSPARKATVENRPTAMEAALLLLLRLLTLVLMGGEGSSHGNIYIYPHLCHVIKVKVPPNLHHKSAQLVWSTCEKYVMHIKNVEFLNLFGTFHDILIIIFTSRRPRHGANRSIRFKLALARLFRI